MTAVVVFGMHRSGTSCLAGLLQAGAPVSSGPSVRNWDNARGHFESLAMVRLNEAVLAASGGHWLAPPAEVRWTEEQGAERDALLATPIEGRAPLLKDPRTLLCLPFWRDSRVPFHALGIVRHPLAVARSLASWRDLPLATGLALWTAHNRILLADRTRHGYPILDFERSKEHLVASVAEACRGFGWSFDPEGASATYEERLVHHDAGEADELHGLDEAMTVFGALTHCASPTGPTRPQRPFPRSTLLEFERRLVAGDRPGALSAARTALLQVDDACAVVVPVLSRFIRAGARAESESLLAEASSRLEPGLAQLLLGKIRLAFGDARGAVSCLQSACSSADPLFQARRLLPQALRRAGQKREARQALAELAEHALYPHAPLAQLAEWTWSGGDRRAALEHMTVAIAAAPPHRRGRLRTRRAEWLTVLGEMPAAEGELDLALQEDPAYPRAREALERLRTRRRGSIASG